MHNGGNKQGERSKHDFYSTPAFAIERLWNFISPLYEQHQEYPIFSVWEPAAGTGAIARVISALSEDADVVQTDLYHYDNSELVDGKVDFLTHEWALTNWHFDLIVTNPPFDQAEDFIKRGVSLWRQNKCKMFVLLLKATYWHAKSRQELFNSSGPNFILPLTKRLDFEGKGRPVMECAWNVWYIAGAGRCEYRPI